jgi:hypothetical protein
LCSGSSVGVDPKRKVHRLFGGWTLFVDKTDQSWLELIRAIAGEAWGRVWFLDPCLQERLKLAIRMAALAVQTTEWVERRCRLCNVSFCFIGGNEAGRERLLFHVDECALRLRLLGFGRFAGPG